MSYEETLKYLFTSFPVFQHIGASAYKPGLDSTIRFLEHLGNPHHQFRSIHIAGTNGKGSVSNIIAAILRSAGYRVGLYTSPHMIDLRERIVVNDEVISRRSVVYFVASHREVMEELQLSFFEMMVGMAFEHFVRSEIDIAVVETGLGGRLDSTNVIIPLLSIITNIGFDHTNLLGATLPLIAQEKAGIIKSLTPVVIGEHNSETDPVFEQHAKANDSPLWYASDHYLCHNSKSSPKGQAIHVEDIETGLTSELTLRLEGHYQRSNIATVLTSIKRLTLDGHVIVSGGNIAEGCLSKTLERNLMGRWQKLADHPLTIGDSGHNEHGIRMVIKQLATIEYGRLIMIIGVVSDKDLSKILPLFPKDAYYIFTSPSIERGLPADILAKEAGHYGLKGDVRDTVAEAYEHGRELATENDLIFIGGSTFTVSDAVKIFK